MNKSRNNEQLELLADRYLKKIFSDNNRPKNGIQDFLDEIKTKIGLDCNYMHAHPLIVQWCVVSNCNLRCKHCYYKENAIRYDSTEDLSTQESLKLIDSFDELNVYHVKVTGGEPFLRKDIFEILKKLKSKNIILYIQTNGTLINEKMAKELSTILVPNVDIVQISLDGYNKETHEKSRGKGSFASAIQGVNNLVVNNITTYVNCTATSLNILEIPNLYKMTQKLKVKNFTVSEFKACAESQDYLVPSFEVKLKIMNELLDMQHKTTNLELSAIKLYEFINNNIGVKNMAEFVDSYKIDYTGKNIACQKHDRLSITGNGNVYLCDATAIDEFCLGNVKESLLNRIWENRYNNIFFQEKIYDNFPCKNCKYFLFCKGGCPMEAYKKYKTINAPDRNCLLGAKFMSSKNKEM